jgi:DNA-binding MarR family transcriptional regulator
MKWLRWLAVAVAPLGILVKMVVDKRRSRVSPDDVKVLRYLATHTSGPVPELSTLLNLAPEETLRVLTELEQRGLVQLSADQGIGHVRIAAITKSGRELAP